LHRSGFKAARKLSKQQQFYAHSMKFRGVMRSPMKKTKSKMRNGHFAHKKHKFQNKKPTVRPQEKQISK